MVNQQKDTWEISNTKCFRKRFTPAKKFAEESEEIKKSLNYMSDQLSKDGKKNKTQCL